MKTTITLSLMCLFLLGFKQASIAQELKTLQKLRIEKQVDSVFQLSIKAAENLDYDKLSNGVDDRYKAGFISNNSFYASYDSLVNLARTRARGLVKQTISISQEKVTALTENIALVTASGDAKVEVYGGNEFAIKFNWTFVYARINNGWKVVQSHQSGQRQ
jgi:hypothetical protein